MAATSAFAQSSVTLYGIVDVGINQTKADSGTSVLKSTNTGGNAKGGWASNRIGFKGTEDIGGGLKANFVYEMAMDAGTTGDLATSGGVRQSFASLADAKMGEVSIGRQYTPIFSSSAALDAGAANNIAHGRVIYGKVATTRNSGQMMYTSPSFSGLTGKYAYAKSSTEINGTNLPTDYVATGGSLVYANGPLTAHAAYNLTKLDASLSATNSDKMETLFGASYMVGKATVLGMYGKSKIVGNAGAQSDLRRGYQLGLRYPITSNVDSFLTYGRAKVQGASTAAEGTAKGTQVGAIYNLSKRTGLYAAYGKTSGDTSNAAIASKGTEFAVGVRHSF